MFQCIQKNLKQNNIFKFNIWKKLQNRLKTQELKIIETDNQRIKKLNRKFEIINRKIKINNFESVTTTSLILINSPQNPFASNVP